MPAGLIHFLRRDRLDHIHGFQIIIFGKRAADIADGDIIKAVKRAHRLSIIAMLQLIQLTRRYRLFLHAAHQRIDQRLKLTDLFRLGVKTTRRRNLRPDLHPRRQNQR